MRSLHFKKNNQNGSVPWQILIILAVVLVVPVTLFLVRQNQDIRQRAATPTANCVPGEDANSLTRWGWLCTGTNVTNRPAKYYAFQCPQSNLQSCDAQTAGGILIPLTCANIEGNNQGALNCHENSGFLEMNLPQSRTFLTNNLPLGQCGCVQTDYEVSENGATQVAGGQTRCFAEACNTTLSCNQLTGKLLTHSQGGSSQGVLTPSTPDLTFQVNVSGSNIERTEICFAGKKNAEGTQFTGAKCLRQVSPNTTFSYNGNPGVFNFVPGTTAMTIPPANGLTYNYITSQLGMTDQEKQNGVVWGVNVMTAGSLCEGGSGKLLSRSTGQQIGNCSVNASCKGALRISLSPSPSIPPSTQCTGVNIACSGQCAANGGVDYTCNWTKPAGATEFAMAYKDTTASSSAWKYEISNDTLSANRWLNDKTRWVKSFTTNVSRDFMLRVYTSTTCTPHVGAYGNRATVAALTCGALSCNQDCIQHSQCQTGHCNAGKCRNAACTNSTTCSCATPPPSARPSPGPQCQDIRIYKLNGPANTLASWGEPLSAEELASMSAGGTLGPNSQLYFTVTGNNVNSAPLISYQKGRIRVNVGANQGEYVETQNTKPADGNLSRVEYYIIYTIPQFTTQTAFTVEGEVCAAQGDSCTWH